MQIGDLVENGPQEQDGDTLRGLLSSKTVMITGAGGSIGSELARQVVKLGPGRLLLIERSEFALFNIDRELRESGTEAVLVPLVADVGDQSRMRRIFETHSPNVVLHAAAHKHVPLMEFNVAEAVKNNCIGADVIGRIAGEAGADVFLLISTDKAVRPVSIMGATKRLAELIIQDLNRQFPTKYISVRFGNVIGSTGSVMPIFQQQISAGGPVTITHPGMARYFIPVSEAAELALQAAAIGKGGDVLVVDMGEPVLIVDLAERLIKQAGLRPYQDIQIVFTGIRPGERLVEEIQTDSARLGPTGHPKLHSDRAEYRGHETSAPGPGIEDGAKFSPGQDRHSITELAIAASDGDEATLRTLLSDLIPEAELGMQPSYHAAGEPLSTTSGDHDLGDQKSRALVTV